MVASIRDESEHPRLDIVRRRVVVELSRGVGDEVEVYEGELLSRHEERDVDEGPIWVWS